MSRKKKSALAELPRVSLAEGLAWRAEQELKARQARKRLAEEGEKRLRKQVRNKKGPGKGHLWPMKSESLACHPDQVAEANERARRHGIAARYRRDGTCVIQDNGARTKLLRLENVRDRAGYSR